MTVAGGSSSAAITEPVVLPWSAPGPDHPLLPLVEQLPTTIALAVAEYLRESSTLVPFQRLADAAELITRFFAIVTLSDARHRLDKVEVHIGGQAKSPHLDRTGQPEIPAG